MFVFFFFKQKTAYEIQGDWSSDVCSSVLVFLGLALASGRARGAAALAAAAGALWVVAHYASGFGALEATVVRATSAVPPDIAASFLRLNVPIHFFHSATLVTALGALLTVPRSASRRKD